MFAWAIRADLRWRRNHGSPSKGIGRRPLTNLLRWGSDSIFEETISRCGLVGLADTKCNAAPNATGRSIEQPRRRSGLHHLPDLCHQSCTDRYAVAPSHLG
jgi:hypothetical protein